MERRLTDRVRTRHLLLARSLVAAAGHEKGWGVKFFGFRELDMRSQHPYLRRFSFVVESLYFSSPLQQLLLVYRRFLHLLGLSYSV